MRSWREVVDYLQVLNSKNFWEVSDSIEEEALFEVLGGATREQVQDGDGWTGTSPLASCSWPSWLPPSWPCPSSSWRPSAALTFWLGS